MNVRALTGFLDPGWPLKVERLASVVGCLRAARQALAGKGYAVQSLRLAAPPPGRMGNPVPPSERPELARRLVEECTRLEVDYVCLGPALPEEAGGFAVIPAVLAAADNVFCSGLFADQEHGLSLSAAKGCAAAIRDAAAISPDGFANLRFAALANVPPGVPFFPASYHAGGGPALGLATEAADLAVDAFGEAGSLEAARESLVSAIETHAAALFSIVEGVTVSHSVRFLGIDFSLAPFPDARRSLGAALEALGVPCVGLAGTAAAAAFLASCLQQARFQRTGFCGLFFPVLEDAILAARAAEGHLTVTDLLLYATLCGTGLDTLPVPGDTSQEQLTALLLDLGALAVRHGKPLTARLMPIPGKVAGDEVCFDFPYFAPSRVLALRAAPLTGPLGGSGEIELGLRQAGG